VASTQDQIKSAARTLFLKQGYAATTTRDIAKAADTNVALINYYFRSKENLFAEIMIEQVRSFAHGLSSVVNDPDTDLREKFTRMADAYLTLFEEQPDTPLFVLSELRNEPQQFLQRIGMRDAIKNSVLFAQLQEAVANGSLAPVNPVHVVMNLMSLMVFPIIAKPMLMGAAGVDDATFTALMRERRELVPLWIDAMFMKR
jgi:AcrR family transcriptional regulator